MNAGEAVAFDAPKLPSAGEVVKGKSSGGSDAFDQLKGKVDQSTDNVQKLGQKGKSAANGGIDTKPVSLQLNVADNKVHRHSWIVHEMLDSPIRMVNLHAAHHQKGVDDDPCLDRFADSQSSYQPGAIRTNHWYYSVICAVRCTSHMPLQLDRIRLSARAHADNFPVQIPPPPSHTHTEATGNNADSLPHLSGTLTYILPLPPCEQDRHEHSCCYPVSPHPALHKLCIVMGP